MILPPNTQRLIFRPITVDDVGNLHAIFGDAVARRHFAAVLTLEETRASIERTLLSYARHGHGFWAVCLRETEEFIGQCGILHQEERARPDKEIAYSLQRRFWGNGYATEAARAVKTAAFQQFDFPAVVSFIVPENERSINVARRVGMMLEEVLPPESNKWKRIVHVYSIQREPRPG